MARRRLRKDVDQFHGSVGKYRPEYCRRVIEFMGEGHSIVQFAALVGVHVDTVYNWAEQRPEFDEALKQARVASEAYWEGEVRKMMTMKDINVALVNRYMATRFKWTDRVAEDHTSSDGSMTPSLTVVFE